MKDIAAAAANRAAFERGVEYYNQRRVSKLKRAKDEQDTGEKVTAEVRGGKYNYEVEVSFDQNGEMKESWCDCPAFYEYEGCCKHIVAVLLCCYALQKTDAGGERGENENKTDRYAGRMLGHYSKKALSEAMAHTIVKKARLVPSLEYDYNGRLNLSFTVGHERQYILRDLSKFFFEMRQGGTVEYGAKLTLTHDISAFEEASRPLVRFFMSRYADYMQFAGDAGGYKAGKRSLTLSSSAFDELFGLLVGQKVAMRVDFRNEKHVLFTDENPVLSLQVQEAGDAFLLSLSELPVFLYMGEKNAYVMLGERLFRCAEDYTAATREFLRAFTDKGGELTINRKEMPAFCANVLDVICSHIEVENADMLDCFRPAPLKAKLYLDMPSSMMVTGTLKYCYEATEINAMDEQPTPSVQRDVRGEYIARSLVDKYLPSYNLQHRLLYVDDEERIYALLSEGIAELSTVASVYATDRLGKVTIRKPPAVSVGVRLKSDLLNVTFDTGDFPRDELLDLLKSYRQHKKYHKLSDGSFVTLEDDTLGEVSELAQSLDLSDDQIKNGEADVHRYRAMVLDNILRDSALIQSDRDPGFKSMLRELRSMDDADIQPPESLRHILRNYQKKAFRWLKTMARYGLGGILADDMGLGKTLETIAFLLHNHEESTENKRISLVVCPTSLVLNWVSEIARFAPGLQSLAIMGSAAQRAELVAQIPQYDIIITSYELLKRDIDLYKPYTFDCEIIDEAQYVKNASTQNARAVKQIRSEHRFALTGTPVENSLAELWSIFDFLMPGYLYSHAKFRETFELPVVKGGDEQALDRLRRMLSPFILRRLKSSVLRELPPKTETVLYAPLDGEQKKLYMANLASIRQELTGSLQNSNKLIVLAMLTRLRQLCCDPSLYYEDYTGGSAKLELCMELLRSVTESGHKVLLFSQFTSMLSIIADRLTGDGIGYYVLKGSTSKEERARLTTRFNNDDTPVFLISLKAGGTGLNLTAADIVIHYDPWWNVSAQNQATDRAHRIGQKSSVQVYKLIAKDTIEEKILKLQQDKLKLADSVISEGDGIISRMSPQELLALFDPSAEEAVG
ncbi:calcium-binding protein [Ethanoligenens harbinense]|nr:calcium-binding protein [Ethanoligenens harbinense YUAN-3]AYF37678.1 calcium-binding protein [Ethanoligenens harbinense]AYF40398.1 calcium-binding protein [Ethanoligenens harbinense]QCN91233.1 calcium-binding protein [Ethanoligenens harbinense]